MAKTKRDDATPSESPPERPEAASPAPQSQTASSGPGREDRIRQAAYDLSLKRGSEPGSDVDDWLEAERQIDVGGADKPA